MQRSYPPAGRTGAEGKIIASYRQWTQEDDRRLLEMRTAGKSPAVMAKELKSRHNFVLHVEEIGEGLSNRSARDIDHFRHR
jgi:hypothetical protein